MRRSLWVLVLAVACSHPAPVRDDHRDQPRPVDASMGTSVDSASAGSATADEVAPPQGSSSVAPSNGDRLKYKPVDGWVSHVEHSSGKLTFTIQLPDRAEKLGVEAGWRGAFMENGKAVANSDFTILKTNVRQAFVTFGGQELPGKTVRIYPCCNRNDLEH